MSYHEESGHRWPMDEHGVTNDARCVRCGLKFAYYTDMKRFADKQPWNKGEQERLKCKPM